MFQKKTGGQFAEVVVWCFLCWILKVQQKQKNMLLNLGSQNLGQFISRNYVLKSFFLAT